MKWSVIVPVKGTSAAKSRLASVLGDRREDLARALALDTLIAAADVEFVDLVVVTGDRVVAAHCLELGALVVADDGRGLDAALAAGMQAALEQTSVAATSALDGAGSGLAILLGDLPALRPEDLATALDVCGRAGTAFVPDAEGSGTVLLASRDPGALVPRFGPSSAAEHGRYATRLDLDLPRLRHDVDVAADLEAVLVLGVGRHTAALLAQLSDVPPASEPVGSDAGGRGG